MLTSIAGRSVIVTGASKGIGRGIAKVFCKNGGKVLVVSRNIQEAEACAEELRRAGGAARGCAADVTKIDDMQMLAETAAAVHGGIDILCANAGIFPQAKIEDLSSEDWDQVMATNLKGTFLAVKACLPHLKRSDQGRIVLTSSSQDPLRVFQAGATTPPPRLVSLDSCAQPASSWPGTASPSTQCYPAIF
jgi:3-oxoacyl-[acyl-carrier protein] reductase